MLKELLNEKKSDIEKVADTIQSKMDKDILKFFRKYNDAIDVPHSKARMFGNKFRLEYTFYPSLSVSTIFGSPKISDHFKRVIESNAGDLGKKNTDYDFFEFTDAFIVDSLEPEKYIAKLYVEFYA